MISHAAQRLCSIFGWRDACFEPRAVILLYHRIIELPSDPYLLSVSPSHFAEHLTVLRSEARLLSLRQLIDGLRERKIPRRAVVITFDDGYFDNFVYAKPILEREGAAATVFVTPGSLQEGREFWWDTLDKVLLKTRSLPSTLRLVIGGVAHQWDLGAAPAYGGQDPACFRFWNYGCKDDPTPRHTIFRSIHFLLRAVDEQERRKVMEDLTAWAAADTAVDPNYRMLSAAETVRLGEGQLIEVGAHTMTHPVLSRLSLAEQQGEIQQSKSRLEALIGRPVNSFAYPHGLSSDFTQETAALVRDAGFDCGCAAMPGIVRRDTSAYELPRLTVRDEDGDQFAERLSAYFRD
jgi:peptidoglycan/xylan/chitin deacetylase (PgdA/CDA1 family)